MEGIINPSNIAFVVGLLGVLFGVYHYFRNPQIDSDKRDALIEQRMKFYGESTDRRFSDMQKQITDSQQLANNHIHTIDTKVDEVNKNLSTMGKEITRLATIIEERIPKK